MAIQYLEVMVNSANDLKDHKHVNKMDPFAIVSLRGSDKQCTSVHKKGGTNPSWYYSVVFRLDEAAARRGHLSLVFRIMTKKFCRSDKHVAVAVVPVRQLLERQGDGNSSPMRVTLQPQGVLEFSYNFSDEAPPAPRTADQERSRESSRGALTRMMLFVGQMTDIIVEAVNG